MYIVGAGYLVGVGGSFKSVRDFAVCFDRKIVDIGRMEELRARYPQAEAIDLGADAVVLPGLINPHVHLEFSANRSLLKLGGFIPWLKSVIAQREQLLERCRKEECVRKALRTILRSGTTAIGAISSFGADLHDCVHTPMKVVYFNEVLGSSPAAVDALYGDFLQRYEASESHACERFVPAISVHAPYSTHPVLARKALELARSDGRLVSTHFLESPAELAWLERGEGEFVSFFASFMPDAKPMSTPESYLELFEGVPTLLTHAVQSSAKILDRIAEAGMKITHCPRSNTLLHTGRLDLEALRARGISWSLGSDGLSSNRSLSLWDEMRAALLLHHRLDPVELAAALLEAATAGGAQALDLEAGRIEPGRAADLIVVRLEQEVAHPEDLPLQLILHTQAPERIYIAGEVYDEKDL